MHRPVSSVHKAGAGGSRAFIYMHLHAAPLGVVVAHADWRASDAILAALDGSFMQHPANELPRIPLPRTRVNRVGRLGMAAKEENCSIEEVDRRIEANSLLSGRFFFVILCNQEGSLIG